MSSSPGPPPEPTFAAVQTFNELTTLGHISVAFLTYVLRSDTHNIPLQPSLHDVETHLEVYTAAINMIQIAQESTLTTRRLDELLRGAMPDLLPCYHSELEVMTPYLLASRPWIQLAGADSFTRSLANASRAEFELEAVVAGRHADLLHHADARMRSAALACLEFWEVIVETATWGSVDSSVSAVNMSSHEVFNVVRNHWPEVQLLLRAHHQNTADPAQPRAGALLPVKPNRIEEVENSRGLYQSLLQAIPAIDEHVRTMSTKDIYNEVNERWPQLQIQLGAYYLNHSDNLPGNAPVQPSCVEEVEDDLEFYRSLIQPSSTMALTRLSVMSVEEIYHEIETHWSEVQVMLGLYYEKGLDLTRARDGDIKPVRPFRIEEVENNLVLYRTLLQLLYCGRRSTLLSSALSARNVDHDDNVPTLLSVMQKEHDTFAEYDKLLTVNDLGYFNGLRQWVSLLGADNQIDVNELRAHRNATIAFIRNWMSTWDAVFHRDDNGALTWSLPGRDDITDPRNQVDHYIDEENWFVEDTIHTNWRAIREFAMLEPTAITLHKSDEPEVYRHKHNQQFRLRSRYSAWWLNTLDLCQAARRGTITQDEVKQAMSEGAIFRLLRRDWSAISEYHDLVVRREGGVDMGDGIFAHLAIRAGLTFANIQAQDANFPLSVFLRNWAHVVSIGKKMKTREIPQYAANLTREELNNEKAVIEQHLSQGRRHPSNDDNYVHPDGYDPARYAISLDGPVTSSDMRSIRVLRRCFESLLPAYIELQNAAAAAAIAQANAELAAINVNSLGSTNPRLHLRGGGKEEPRNWARRAVKSFAKLIQPSGQTATDDVSPSIKQHGVPIKSQHRSPVLNRPSFKAPIRKPVPTQRSPVSPDLQESLLQAVEIGSPSFPYRQPYGPPHIAESSRTAVRGGANKEDSDKNDANDPYRPAFTAPLPPVWWAGRDRDEYNFEVMVWEEEIKRWGAREIKASNHGKGVVAEDGSGWSLEL